MAYKLYQILNITGEWIHINNNVLYLTIDALFITKSWNKPTNDLKHFQCCRENRQDLGCEEGETIEQPPYRLINFIMKMNESHLKLEFYPLHSAASSCNLKCALDYRDGRMSLIIHESLPETQQAKLCTILDFSTLIGHPVFAASCLQVRRVSQQMRPGWLSSPIVVARVWFKSNSEAFSAWITVKLRCREIQWQHEVNRLDNCNFQVPTWPEPRKLMSTKQKWKKR